MSYESRVQALYLPGHTDMPGSYLRGHNDALDDASPIAAEADAEVARLTAERDEARAALVARDARIERLEEALRPMAEVAGDAPAEWADDHQCITECGHFRRAARALAEEQAP